jgi:hypothetical protein
MCPSNAVLLLLSSQDGFDELRRKLVVSARSLLHTLVRSSGISF